jgi:putative N6-adenine-specific DNA methylase
MYEAARSFPWEDYITPQDSFAVEASLSSGTFTNSNYCALTVKDAVADRFQDKFGSRPNVNSREPSLLINLFVKGTACTLSLDVSGGSLHRRGYRLEKTEAPLNEVLAAGILLLSGWDGSIPLYDPMCGSGTFLAEAGLMASDTPAGFLRTQAPSAGWKTWKPELWKKVTGEALSRRKALAVRIWGADSSPQALDTCRSNLARAGLEKDVSLTRAVFEDASPPSEKGVLVMNPPYGKRLAPETSGEIAELYKRIGDTLKRKYTGWTAWIFSANKDALKHIGLRPFCRFPLKNGPLDCRLAGFRLF